MFTEDLTVFVESSGLGDTANISGSAIYGIFSREYVEVANVEGYYPTFLVSDTDAASVTKNSTVLTINSTNYYAISKRPDGTGMTLLVLEEQ